MISNIAVNDKNYFYKGIEYDNNNLELLLNKISKKRNIILYSQNILIKKYKYFGNSIEKFIDSKISEDFANKENLLFHYEIDKYDKNIYLYSIRNNIKRLYEDSKELSVELLEFKIKFSVEKKLKRINNIIILYKINNRSHLLKIRNNIMIDIITSTDINEIKKYLSDGKNKKFALVKDKQFKELENIDFDYSIDLGVDTYEKICKE